MLNRILRRLLVAGLCLLMSVLMSPLTQAHHSQSEFDSKLPVDVAGSVTKLEWKSPHARLYVDVVNAKGDTENWNFELPSPNTLMRRGWTRKALQAGDKVRVTGARARNFPTIAYATSIFDTDGKPLFTGITVVNAGEPEADK
jgi:hypothetical protein